MNDSGFPARQNEERPLVGVTILLVEDAPINVLFGKRMLEKLGAVVDVATDGQMALDMLDSSKHHLVLMDIQMPVMDGYESVRQMRQRGEKLPIIALTAGLEHEGGEAIQSKGMNDFLSKPLGKESLLRMVLKYVPL